MKTDSNQKTKQKHTDHDNIACSNERYTGLKKTNRL